MATSSDQGFAAAALDSIIGNAVLGAGAFVLNYVVVLLFLVIDNVKPDPFPIWKVAGWTFFNAQNVQTKLSGGPISQSFSLLEPASGGGSNITSTIPKLAYYIVPALVLLGAGYYAYQRAGRELDTADAVGTGAGIVGGYLVLTVISIFVFKGSNTTNTAFSHSTAVIQPKMVTGIIIAGLVYPVVLGAIGGAIGSETA